MNCSVTADEGTDWKEDGALTELLGLLESQQAMGIWADHLLSYDFFFISRNIFQGQGDGLVVKCLLSNGGD